MFEEAGGSRAVQAEKGRAEGGIIGIIVPCEREIMKAGPSVPFRTKNISVFVRKRTVRVNRDWNYIYFHRDSIIKIPFSGNKLLKSDYCVIGNFFLRLQFCLKHDEFVMLTG